VGTAKSTSTAVIDLAHHQELHAIWSARPESAQHVRRRGGEDHLAGSVLGCASLHQVAWQCGDALHLIRRDAERGCEIRIRIGIDSDDLPTASGEEPRERAGDRGFPGAAFSRNR
jgi:hypothetical protein